MPRKPRFYLPDPYKFTIDITNIMGLYMYFLKILSKALFLVLVACGLCQAQFLDSFDSNKIKGWEYFTGDGAATMDFIQKDGYARILVDATKDKHNVWWAITKRDVSAFLDLKKLEDPAFELRVEAKVRLSHAPRRVNFMINTQRTTNYHEHLMEFDIPTAGDWHTISMTTKNLDAIPGDSVYVQMNVTDWGIGQYFVDVDYYRAEIVNVNEVGPDKGEPLPYHPPVPGIASFKNHIDVFHSGLINPVFPDINFSNWHDNSEGSNISLLTVDSNQSAILRWNLKPYQNSKIDGSGLLELVTHSVQKGGNYIEVYGKDFGMEFGKVRIIEIFGGDSEWDQKKVTFNSFVAGSELINVVNSQMVFDTELCTTPGCKNFITLSRPVLQRMLDGKTKGLLIQPLGALTASFYTSKNEAESAGPKLHFNTSH